MKHKLFLTIAILSLLSLAVFVSAIIDEGDMTVSVYVSEGWNLVSSGTFAVNPLQNSDIKIEDISAIYYYNTQMNEYRRVYPKSEILADELLAYYEGTYAPAAWIYSKKSGNLIFRSDDILPLDERPIFKGWNLVSITPMVTKILFEKSIGTCNIERSYFYNTDNNEWVSYSVSSLFNEIDGPEDEDFVGLGWVIKVSEDCNLGSSVTPPTLP
tara:strand:- start:24 stop:662 length:639 start_codon:yes stop_codon:yes gene_type:complete